MCQMTIYVILSLLKTIQVNRAKFSCAKMRYNTYQYVCGGTADDKKPLFAGVFMCQRVKQYGFFQFALSSHDTLFFLQHVSAYRAEGNT